MANIPIRARVKMAKFKAVTNGSGVAEILLSIPASTRALKGGCGYFETPHADDYMTAEIVLLSDPSVVVKTLYEDELAPENEGWFFNGVLKISPIDEIMIIDYGAQLKIKAYKGDSSVDTLRGNIEWGLP